MSDYADVLEEQRKLRAIASSGEWKRVEECKSLVLSELARQAMQAFYRRVNKFEAFDSALVAYAAGETNEEQCVFWSDNDRYRIRVKGSVTVRDGLVCMDDVSVLLEHLPADPQASEPPA